MMFLASVFISRYGGKELFGYFGVLLGLIISATPFATFGMDTAIVRYLPQYRRDGKGHLISGMQRFVLLFSAVLSLVGGGLLALILMVFKGYGWQVGLSTGVCLPLSVSLVVLQNILRADGRVVGAVCGEAVARPLLFTVLLLSIFLLVADRLTLSFIVLSYALALLAANFAVFWLILKWGTVDWRGKFDPKLVDVRLWLHLGWISLLSAASIALLNQSPIIIAGVVLSAFDAGELWAVMRLSTLVVFALGAVNSVVLPFLSRAKSRGDKAELQNLIVRANAFSIFVAIPALFVLFVFAPFFLSLFGNNYFGAVPYLRIMLIGYTFQLFCGPVGSLLNMAGIHRAMAKIVTIWAAITVVGLFVAMNQIGLHGGVVVAAVSVAGYPVLLAILCRKTLGVDPTVLSLRFLLKR